MNPPTALTYGSVCSGIEAPSAAWHPLGWKPLWFSEIEPFPKAVLAHRYPEVPDLGDMTTLPARILSGEVPDVDVFVGGTPCQSFSVAGLRLGLADPRGQLTRTYVEILDALDTVRLAKGKPPTVALWENVPGVLSDKDNAFGNFLGALCGEDHALLPAGPKWTNAGSVSGPRRALAWRVLDAQHFGVAQRRRRVFVVASARAGGVDPVEVLLVEQGVCWDPPSRGEARPSPAASPAPGAGSSSGEHGADGGDGGGGGVAYTFRADAMREGTAKTPSADAEGRVRLRDPGMGMYEEVAPTLDCGQPHGVAQPAIAFDTTQLTNPHNRSNPQPGDPCHPLAAGAHPPAVAFAQAAYPDPAYAISGGEQHFGTGRSNQDTFVCSSPPAVSFAQNQLGEVRVGEVFNTLNTNSNASGRNTAMVAQGFDSYNLQLTGPVGQTVKSPQGGVLESVGGVLTFEAPAIGVFKQSDVAGVMLKHTGMGSGETQNPAFVLCANEGVVGRNAGMANDDLDARRFALQPRAIFTGDGAIADPIGANEAKTYTNEGSRNFRLHNCVGEPRPHSAQTDPPVVCVTGDRTHALTTRCAAEEDGTGMGNPIVNVSMAFKASHYTRGKDGAPSEVFPPLSADADKGDQDPVVLQAIPVLSFKPGQSEAAGGVFITEEFAPTLQAQNNGSTATPAVLQAMAVRRLTPVECERLQGFPDDYTDIPWKGKPAGQCPDGPRYKALGNSMAVPVIRWIGLAIGRSL